MNVLFNRLKEREKELNCLYKVDEILKKYNSSFDNIFNELITIIPQGFQYSTVCESRIEYQKKIYQTADFKESEWNIVVDIKTDNTIEGNIYVCYTQFIRLHNTTQFLPEEYKLLNTIANRIENHLFQYKLKQTIELLNSPEKYTENDENNITILTTTNDEHWRWRKHIAQQIANTTDFKRFGIKAIYLIGSSKNATASIASDIDLLVHVDATPQQLAEFTAYIEGWSLCLTEYNYLKTGYKTTHGLIDLHIITDENIKQNDSFAVMIGSHTNSALLLK